MGGAHRDRDLMLDNLRSSISKNLEYFNDLSADEIMNERKDKFLKIGRNKGFVTNSDNLSTLIDKNNHFEILKSKKFLIGSVVVGWFYCQLHLACFKSLIKHHNNV